MGRHTPEAVAVIPTTNLNGLGAADRFLDAAPGQAEATLLGYDAVNVNNLPGNGEIYFSYIDGNYPNSAEVNARFPTKIRPTITTGYGPADWIDCEPGNASWFGGPLVHDIAGWMAGRHAAGVARPGLYVSASYAQGAINGLTALGWPRSRWRLGPAHWTNERHICAPSVCGYPAADYTQYGGNVGGADGYDIDLAYTECFNATPPTPPTPPEDEVQHADVKVECNPQGFGYAVVNHPKGTTLALSATAFSGREATELPNANLVSGAKAGTSGIRVFGKKNGTYTVRVTFQ